jgi:hypothetical protein
MNWVERTLMISAATGFVVFTMMLAVWLVTLEL